MIPIAEGLDCEACARAMISAKDPFLGALAFSIAGALDLGGAAGFLVVIGSDLLVPRYGIVGCADNDPSVFLDTAVFIDLPSLGGVTRWDCLSAIPFLIILPFGPWRSPSAFLLLLRVELFVAESTPSFARFADGPEVVVGCLMGWIGDMGAEAPLPPIEPRTELRNCMINQQAKSLRREPHYSHSSCSGELLYTITAGGWWKDAEESFYAFGGATAPLRRS